MTSLNIIKQIKIKNNTITINDNVVFHSDEETFSAFAKSVYKKNEINYSKFYKMSHLCKLGFLASELLLLDVDFSDIEPEDVSIIIANSSSSLHTDTEYQNTLEGIPSPSVFVYTLPNIVIGEICIKNNFKGEGVFFIQKEFDYEFISNYARNLFENGKTRMCIFGWLEIDSNENYEAVLYLAK
ncbi:MAG: 3-oxoacyl-ACP synthase [Bacteroidota bacterium]